MITIRNARFRMIESPDQPVTIAVARIHGQRSPSSKRYLTAAFLHRRESSRQEEETTVLLAFAGRSAAKKVAQGASIPGHMTYISTMPLCDAGRIAFRKLDMGLVVVLDGCVGQSADDWDVFFAPRGSALDSSI
jgi:hypothetical protein